MELCTHCTNATPIGTTARTHTHTPLLGRCWWSCCPHILSCWGSPHSPCWEIGQNASAVPPGRSQACGTWRASVSVTPGPRHSPLTGTQWRAACRQTRAGTDNIVNRAEWQTGLSGQRGIAAQRLENIFPSIFRHFSPFKHRKFHFALFHLTASISQGVCFWYTGMKSFAFYGGVWITGKIPTPPSLLSALILNLTPATMSAHCSKISTLFRFLFPFVWILADILQERFVKRDKRISFPYKHV